MKPITLLSVVACASLLACDSPAPTDPIGDDVQAATVALSSSATTHKFVQTSTGDAIMLGWCNEAAGIAFMSAPGTGHGTHIGHFTVEQTQCVDLATGVATNGHAIVTTANGDEVHATYAGQAAPGNGLPVFDIHYAVAGGTGRFTNVTGELDIHVEYTSPTTWVSTGGGWMQYAASDRSMK